MDRVNITSVVRFSILPDDTKRANKIKVDPKHPRYDCTGYYADLGNGSDFVGPLANDKNQCNVSVIPCYHIVEQADAKRLSDYAVKSNKVGNVSSLYYIDPKQKERFFGYTNPNEKLSSGALNPMYIFRNDLLLFWFRYDHDEMVIVVVSDAKRHCSMLYQYFIEGSLDTDILAKLEFAECPFTYRGMGE